MTPAARVQSAINIVFELANTALPADRLLQNWARANRYAGSKDRAAISARVYDVLRHRASFAWRMGREDARALVIASLIAEGADPDTFFTGEGYGPPPLTAEERAAIAALPCEPAPAHVRGEYPLWLEPELECAFGRELESEMRAMSGRAPVDLRVNPLRAARSEMLVGLRSLGVAAEPTPYSPCGIRIASAEGLGMLQQSRFFQTGAFEFQDEASQIAAILCGAEPGMHVLDLAAGAGGKSLALAALMGNRGEILAFDTDEKRLKQVGPRARRAGANIIRATDKRGGPIWGNGKFDVVLVDAPCSGSGAWRRNPEAKWRLTPEHLADRIGLQNWLIDDGARHTREGGRLVYATCSVLPCENEDVTDAFLARNPGFHVVPAREIWHSLSETEIPGLADHFHASPAKTGTDGFFVCIIQRDKPLAG
jgi:16S rRNA (cytosine967-C5)-methyltransferase